MDRPKLVTGNPRLKQGRHHDSLNARAVARDVIEKLKKGEKVKMKPIILAHGYSEAAASTPSTVTKRRSYIEEMKTYTDQLERHRLKVLAAMDNKDLNEEQYRTLSDSQTKLTHDIQLLSGGKTENIGQEEDRLKLKAIVAAIQLGTGGEE